jgi:hypothetical protein
MVLRSTNASILLMFGIFVMRVGLRLLLGNSKLSSLKTQDASCILREVPLVELGRQNPFLKPLDPDPCHIGEKCLFSRTSNYRSMFDSKLIACFT